MAGAPSQYDYGRETIMIMLHGMNRIIIGSRCISEPIQPDGRNRTHDHPGPYPHSIITIEPRILDASGVSIAP